MSRCWVGIELHPNQQTSRWKGLRLTRGKQKFEARSIRHSIDGYTLIFFTPVVSLLGTLLLISLTPTTVSHHVLAHITFTGWNVSIIALLIIGLALYMHGYLEQETQPSRAGIVFLSLIVILWGTFTYFAATFILAIMIDVVIEHPGTQPLAFWDYAEFWMWEIKGIFGMGTGALLITTSLLKRR